MKEYRYELVEVIDEHAHILDADEVSEILEVLELTGLIDEGDIA